MAAVVQWPLGRTHSGDALGTTASEAIKFKKTTNLVELKKEASHHYCSRRPLYKIYILTFLVICLCVIRNIMHLSRRS